MGSSALRTHQNSVRSSLDVGKPVAAKVLVSSEPVRTEPNDEIKAEILALIDEARVKSGLSHKEMQIAAGAAKSAYSEAANGERGNYAVQWLWAQPVSFWVEFIRLVQVAKGITPDTEAAHRREQINETADALFERLISRLSSGKQDGQ